MTKDEAEKLTKDAWPKVSVGYAGLGQGNALGGLNSGKAYETMSPAVFVELAVAIGMLKLDEPKSAVEKFVEAYYGSGKNTAADKAVETALSLAGLKIVEK